MSEMIERVASALAKEQHEELSDWHREEARAAIAAMRDPTVQMLIEGCENYLRNAKMSHVWHTMIDEALK